MNETNTAVLAVDIVEHARNFGMHEEPMNTKVYIYYAGGVGVWCCEDVVNITNKQWQDAKEVVYDVQW